MKYRKKITSFAFLLLGLGGLGLHAQETVTSTGGEATGIGGTTNYTVGQVTYTTNTGANGSVVQGVQQPYEISTTLGINEASINLEMSIYPNPTTNYLTLKVENNENLSYQLYDLQGKIIKSEKISSNATNISLEEQPTAIYFIKVVKNNQIIKTFKIIKN